MANITQDVTLDGVTGFTLGLGSFSWSGGRIPAVRVFNGDAADSYQLNLSLTGAPWIIEQLRLGDFNISATITDANDGVERRIEYLRLGDGGSTVTLFNTRVFWIKGFENEANTITLGAARTTAIELGGGNDRVTTGSGNVTSVVLGGGNDTFTGGAGDAGLVDLGEGNDRFEAAGGTLTALKLGSGTDQVTLTGGGRIGSVKGNEGNKTITLGDDARIESLNLSGAGNRTVRLEDGARIYAIKLDDGTNRVTTGDGNLESYFSFQGTNTLVIGAGGAQQITLAGTSAAQSLTADGFVGSFQVSGTGNVTALLRGGGGNLRTDDGNDRVTVTGSAGVATIRTDSGDDTVTLGAGGAQYVNLGDGDDRVSLTALDPANGVVIQGGNGSDTLDLSRIGQAVFVDLSQIGTFQNFGAPGGSVDVPGVIGYLSIGGIENLIGTARADALTGRSTDNRLTGGAGNDTLSGQAGEDTLLGGKGNDRLTGGDDADTFQFARQDGTDTITDFTIGEDAIAIAGVTRLAQIRFTELGGGGGEGGGAAGAVRLVVNGTTVIVEGVTLAEMRDADNFLF